MVLADVSTWLGFVSTLIWQAILVGVLLLFRKQITELVGRIARFKLGKTEVSFQAKSPDAKQPGGKAQQDINRVGPDGFFTPEGIRHLVDHSQFVEAGERSAADLLLFRTRNQHTWLVATDRKLFCLLDDTPTRVDGELIQWTQESGKIKEVRAGPYRARTGLVDIGERRRWLYSVALHPDPSQLEAQIWAMIRQQT